ncbi:unnamed protein product [Tilletia controversa]|nr:unnamed protein product [Tilletia controversa]CAD6935270.1 unnamed protein product [Tilletia controversa]CAD6943207.1 unnamed protein product [Tilletia controversa]CAD6967036.1 unnamed protein product [Tilletia controversa]CAD6970774.1 unnamed protein product [Tilletia controversa]
MLLADVALGSRVGAEGQPESEQEAASTSTSTTSNGSGEGDADINMNAALRPPAVPQANRLNGDHAASTLADGDSDGAGPSSSSSLSAATTAATEAEASEDGQQDTNGGSSILSPTSTVCRGSYHQCGTARRVKVYELQNDSWFDRGTGYCAGVYDEARDEALLVARREEACTLLARNGPVLSTSNINEAGGGAAPGAGTAGGGATEQEAKSGVAVDANPSSMPLPTAADSGNASAEGSQNTTGETIATAANPGANERGANQGTASGALLAAALTAAADAGATAMAASNSDETLPAIPGAPSGTGGPGGLSGVKPCESEYVIVVTEDLNTDDVILKSRVLRDDVYQRQAETLVVWTEADGTDMALSFQEAEGCHELWEFLTEVQKHFILVDQRQGTEYMLDPDGEDSPTGTPNPNSPTHTLGFGPGSMEDLAQVIENFNLPEPHLATLIQIELKLKEAASKGQTVRDRVAEWMLRENYIQKLLPVFQDAEELENLDSLHLLCTIIQSILMLNDNAIFEHILQDDVFLGVVGMLEYDPEYPRTKASYREYLSDPSRYRKVVEIKDEGIVRKIHQTYRLLYLKDVILARVLDDPTFSILNSFVFYNQVDIVNYCVSNEGFLTELFEIFNPERKEPDSRKFEAVFFLQQLCAMGKQIQLPNRIALYRTLTEWGLLSVVEYALGQNDQTLRNAAAEVLMTIIEYDANSVRLHILEQAEQNSKPLMTVLVDLLHSEEDLGLKTQMAEAVRVLLETNSDGPSAALAAAAAAQNAANGLGGGGRGPNASDPDKFLSWLYDTEIDHLFSPLKELPDFRFLRGGRQLDLVQRSQSALFGHLCDLLSFTMVNHSFRSQYFLISSQISRRVASLLGAREKHIRLSSLRFFKTCLNSNNQYTNRHFAKIDLFGAVLELLAAEADRDNLVSSACLEFFDFIRKENMKQVISHLMENHAAQLQSLAGHHIVGKTFTGLALQFHKNSEVLPAETNNAAEEAEDARRIRDLKRRAGNRTTIDAMEESYFNEDDDEQSISAAEVFASTEASEDPAQPASSSATGSGLAKGLANPSGAVKLVDYGDDDADDDTSMASTAGDEVDGSSAASTSSSSTTLTGALPVAAIELGSSPTAAAASNVKTSPRLKRRRSSLMEESGASGSSDGADEDVLDRLAKKTATAGKRRSAAGAAAGSTGEKSKPGTAGTGKADAVAAAAAEKPVEEEEELEGGFIRVETPTSPTAAKTTNAGRARSGSSSAGSSSGGGGTANGSKKITLSLKGLAGKGKGAGSSSSTTKPK